jgi:hypothetical protein
MESQEVAVILASVGAFVGSIAVGFYRFIRNDKKDSEAARLAQAKQATEEREHMSELYMKSLALLSNTLQENTISNKEIAQATTRAADEAKERNGHLADLQLKSQEMIDRNLDFYRKGIEEIKCQKVKKQTVDEQVIKHSTEE